MSATNKNGHFRSERVQEWGRVVVGGSSIKGGQHDAVITVGEETMYSSWSSDVVLTACLGIWSICRGTVLRTKEEVIRRHGLIPRTKEEPNRHWSIGK